MMGGNRRKVGTEFCFGLKMNGGARKGCWGLEDVVVIAGKKNEQLGLNYTY